jgi:heterodisulfide reductase subunit C
MSADITRTIKYEAERDEGFARWIMGTSGGERLRNCIQCGLCTATCPVSVYMDLTPRRLMNLAREGFRREVLGSVAIWLCTSCYACTVQCPKRIRVTDIMYALKRRAIEDGVFPRGLPIPVLSQEFQRMVRRHGRISEMRLVAMVFLRTNVWKLAGNARLGVRLFRTGRLVLRQEAVRWPVRFRALLHDLGGVRERGPA